MKGIFLACVLLSNLLLQAQLKPEVITYPPFSWQSEIPTDCPFPPSDDFSGIHFPGQKSGFRVGDTWYPTWAEDDRLYSPYTDGHCPRLDGGKDLSISDGVVEFGYGVERTSTGNAVMEGDDPTSLTIYSLGLSHASALPYHGRDKQLAEAPLIIDNQTLKLWSEPYRGWHYHPDHVILPEPDIQGFKDVMMTDVPTVYQLSGDEKWYMSFIGYDGTGYQSFIAESKDLVHWVHVRLAMGYGPEGGFDHGGVVLGVYLYDDYGIKSPRILKKKDGKYYSLYGAYPRQGGYELRPGYEGVARSEDGLTWERARNEPILSIFQEDCGTWEKDCIYQPWLLEHEGEYYNFYNAANGNIEQLGLALSDDLLKWERYEHNPVIPVGAQGSYNERFSSDAKVFWDKDHWVSFFFGVGQNGAHIMVAFSRDLYHWTVDPEPLYKAGGNPSGLDGQYAHKISLVWNPSNLTYYMFYCAVDKDQRRGIGLITSKPLDP